MKAGILIIIVMTMAVLQGCIFAPDAGSDSGRGRYAVSPVPTIGQELLDLDRARAAGAISDAEYERLKARIIDRVN